MLRLPRDEWPPYHFLTSLLLFGAITELLLVCVLSAAFTLAPRIKTVYLLRENGSVDALQASNGRIRWHHQFDHQWNMSGSLLAQTHVVYVGRVSRLCSRSCQGASDTGSVDALKASDGTLLWHHPIDVHNDLGQSVQVMKVIDGVVYVGVGVFPLGSQSGGDVYALRANTGSLLWHYKVSGSCCRGLVMTKTAIYIGILDSRGSHVDALRTDDGSLLWHHQIDGTSRLMGIAVADGVIYLGIFNGPAQGAVDALRASDGSLIWHSQTNVVPLALTVADNQVYVGGFGDQILALDALQVRNGSLIWQYKSARDEGIPYFATGMDGVVYMISGCYICYLDTTGSTLDALRANDGTLLWRYQNPPRAFWGVEVANRMVYLGVLPGGLAALQTTGGKPLWFHAVDDKSGPLALSGDQS